MRKLISRNLLNFIIILTLILIVGLMIIFVVLNKDPVDDQIKINVLAEPSYDFVFIGKFLEGLAIVRIDKNRDAKYGFINTDGEFIVPCEYDYVCSFNEGLAAVSNNGKYGFIDNTGNEVIPLEYEYAICFTNGLAGVRKDGKFGFINSSGETVIPFEYSRITNFFYKTTSVQKDDKYGIIDIDGNIILPFEYDDIDIFYDYGLYYVHKEDKRGLISVSGEFILPCEYDTIAVYVFNGELISVKQNDKWKILKLENYVPESKVIPIEDSRMVTWVWD